jgi:cytochrome P450
MRVEKRTPQDLLPPRTKMPASAAEPAGFKAASAAEPASATAAEPPLSPAGFKPLAPDPSAEVMAGRRQDREATQSVARRLKLAGLVAAFFGFLKGNRATQAAVAAVGAALASLNVTTAQIQRVVLKIREQHLHGPGGGIREVWRNKDRLNEWVLENSRLAGEGKTWGLGPVLVITHPDCVQHILKDSFSNYEKGLEFRTAMGDLLGDGIFNANGERWKTQRKTGVKIFTRRNFSTFIADTFVKHAHTLVGLLELSAQSPAQFDIQVTRTRDCSESAHSPLFATAVLVFPLPRRPAVPPVQEMFYKFTLDSIGEIAFGVELHCLEQEVVPFMAAFDSAQDRMIDRLTDPFLYAFPESYDTRIKMMYQRERDNLESLQILREFGQGVIDMRRATGDAGARQDMLSYFMSHTDEDGQPYTDKYLVDIILNFIIAGRDTTAITLSWATYELTQHPAEAMKLRAEVDQVLGGRQPSFKDIFETMPLLRGFVNEVLRVRPGFLHQPLTRPLPSVGAAPAPARAQGHQVRARGRHPPRRHLRAGRRAGAVRPLHHGAHAEHLGGGLLRVQARPVGHGRGGRTQRGGLGRQGAGKRGGDRQVRPAAHLRARRLPRAHLPGSLHFLCSTSHHAPR